jgi:pilus assembly protein Flp/PilA
MESFMANLFLRFLRNESGATAIEYGLIAALIATALITGATALGTSLNTQFNGLSQQLNLS